MADLSVSPHELDSLGRVLLEGIRAGVAFERANPAGTAGARTSFINPYTEIGLFRAVWDLGFKCGVSAERGELTNA